MTKMFIYVDSKIDLNHVLISLKNVGVKEDTEVAFANYSVGVPIHRSRLHNSDIYICLGAIYNRDKVESLSKDSKDTVFWYEDLYNRKRFINGKQVSVGDIRQFIKENGL